MSHQEHINRDETKISYGSPNGLRPIDALPIGTAVQDEFSQVVLGTRIRIWIALILTQAISNVDSGGCAVLVAYPNGQITQEFDLSAFQVGFVLSAMYLGHTFGCLTAASLLMKFSSKYLLCASLVLYSFCVLGFALSNGFVLSLLMRLIGGYVSALLVVFGPIWVDDFGPPSAKSLWMSLVQAGVPLGITIGYLAIGFVEANTNISWRYFFFAQSSLLILFSIFFLVSPDNALNRPVHFTVQTHDNMEHETLHRSRFRRVLRKVGKLLLNPIYILLILSLCSLYFVVNGLQMWVTSYLEGPPVYAGKNAIVAVFGACSVTGPIAGVLFGGWLVDRAGGYKEMMRTSLISTLLGALACGMSFASLFTSSLGGFAACTWILLFFGGAAVPALVGMSLSTVDKRLRPLASGFGSCMYNLLGFFLGPFIAGAVADSAGVQWGYRCIMGTSSLAVFFTGMVPVVLHYQSQRLEPASPPERERIAQTSETEDTSEVDESFTARPELAKQAVLRTSFAGGRPALALPRSHTTRLPAEEVRAAIPEVAKTHVVSVS